MPRKSPTSILFVTLTAAATLLQTATAQEKVDFSREIKPILESACVRCHGPEKQKGKLRLDSREAWLKGGENGPVFTAGRPDRSEFVERVTLGEDDDDVMPPKGNADHLSPMQIDLVKRWITEGAEWPEGVVAVATSAVPRGEGEGIGPEPSAEERKAIAELEKGGFKVRAVAAGVNWRRADLRTAADKLSAENFAQLARIPSIRELNLAGVKLADENLANLAPLENLAILHLENTPITDAGLPHLGKLEKLTYLNLFGTAVTDAGLKNLAALGHLKSLYLAGTKVTAHGVSALKRQLPAVEIESGAEFAEIAKKDPEPPKKPAATPAPPAKPATTAAPPVKTDAAKP